MDKVEGDFSTSDQYLINEYFQLSDGDYLLTDIGNETFVVPYKYTINAKSPKEAIQSFKRDLLDFLPNERPISSLDVFKAKLKYKAIIRAHRFLYKQNKEKKPVDMSLTAFNKYTHHVNVIGQSMVSKADISELFKDITQLFKRGDYQLSSNIHRLGQKLLKKILCEDLLTKKRLKRKMFSTKAVAAVFTAIVATAGFWYLGKSDKQEVIEVKSPVYTDFRGKVFDDNYGNLRCIEELMPDIRAIILAVEGFADHTYLDGKDIPTCGSGFTFTIDEGGAVKKVCLGDRMKLKDDEIYTKRFIDMCFASILGDSVGRTLNERENLVCIGAGYCWGANAFNGSNFFQAIKDGEIIGEQSRKLSGFRKQKGLLKREFLLSQILNGYWTPKDLLELPIYYIEGKGYVGSCIYELNLRDCLPCKKDKSGQYIKDKNGSDIPVVLSDGYCEDFYADKSRKILNKLISDAQRSSKSYKKVRDFIRVEAIDEIISHNDRFNKLTIKRWKDIQPRNMAYYVEKDGNR